MISEGFSSGAMLLAAHRIAWDTVISRKSSQASASTSLSFFFFASSLGAASMIFVMASSVRM
jgi:hypothetical protein